MLQIRKCDLCSLIIHMKKHSTQTHMASQKSVPHGCFQKEAFWCERAPRARCVQAGCPGFRTHTKVEKGGDSTKLSLAGTCAL